MGGTLAWNCVFSKLLADLLLQGRGVEGLGCTTNTNPCPCYALVWMQRGLSHPILPRILLGNFCCLSLTSNLTLWLLGLPVVSSWPLDGLGSRPTNELNPTVGNFEMRPSSADHGMARLTKMQKNQQRPLTRDTAAYDF